ncbi:electron transport complex subunit RsxG [Ningiella sp. W23]|uniref:electron transport complex subunit RsxG n=1 Tax=Ningiella sp. W23 TaxID=3023715 RepID=UPI003757E885
MPGSKDKSIKAYLASAIGKNGVILAAFALVTTALIALTFGATRDKIEAEKEKQLLSVLNELVPEDAHDNELHLDCIIVTGDELLGTDTGETQRIFRARMNQQPVAAIVETTAPNGYSGDIDLVVAVDAENTSLGARVVEHKETPGLGDKIDLRVSDWILSFSGVSYSERSEQRWQVKKDGGQFDQFTGATITPRAVVDAVKNTVIYVSKHQQTIFETPSNCSADASKNLGVNNTVTSSDVGS